MIGEGRHTVLVVDDEPDVADAYAAQLEGQFEVRTAYSGEAALDNLEPAVDVVLLDRRMPDVSGDEVLDEIRARDLDIRVAMVTAVDPDFDIIDMPFDEYVVKPVSRSDLFEAIERLLTCASYQEELREYFALTSKYATLQNSKRQPELADNEEFERLERQIERRRESLDELVATFDERDFEAVFRDFEAESQVADSP